MENYGLTKFQIKKAHDKIKFNKEFMRSNGIQLDNKIIPFADFVANSYMNSDRYIAELQHRAWSIYEYAEQRGLKNIFITITLPTEWHSKKTFKGRLINNKKFGGRKYMTTIKNKSDNKKYKFLNAHISQNIPFVEPIIDFSNTIDKYTPRNASKQLTKLLGKLFNQRSYRSIETDDRCFFRVIEPHKDGTPHLHMSLFVPADKVNSIVTSLNRLFPAPQSKIETDVKSPVSYLMKYVLKTLDDLRGDNSEKLTNLTLWYLYHGICRFYTSRTFVALEVYRKLNGMYTLRDLTKDYHSEDLQIYINTQTNKIAKIDNEHGTIYTAKPVNWYDKLVDTDHTYLEAEYEPLFRQKQKNPVDVIIDGEEFVYFNGNFNKVKKAPYQMGYLELYDYFHNIDIDTVDDKHYINTRNLMIDKGLMDGERLKLTAMEDMKFEFEGI
ncbi:MAG: replication endonuclease [Sulfurimonas sp.]|nr:replication endonuclease [Sulfurimonas sp.]MBU3939994.1 replication endonuclease [bacterium]MBU4025628.1 replication endonuclease [bacterium]MBU4058579.1 replication endonuclease [bacterium]MBU4109765.1 replication endonuclease [bacterium]